MEIDLFKRLNKISYTVYHSDAGYTMWKDRQRDNKLYSVVQNGDSEVFDIFDGEERPLGNGMTAEKIIDFIQADMGVGPINEIFVDVDDSSFSKTASIISSAAKRHGMDGNSLLADLAARKKMKSGLQGTVKKKRKINIEDLDLDD